MLIYVPASSPPPFAGQCLNRAMTGNPLHGEVGQYADRQQAEQRLARIAGMREADVS